MEAQQVISDLEQLYEKSADEILRRSINRLKRVVSQARGAEIWLSERDFEQILNHPQLYNHAVRTWAFDYRDREIS